MSTPLLALQILSFNVWGLPALPVLGELTPHREFRMEIVCEKLKQGFESSKWDVVFLQEVWVNEDRKKLSQCGFPHSLDLDDPEAFLDSGLLILSRYPFVGGKSFRHTFTEGGDFTRALVDGEAFANKSVLLGKIKLPGDQELWVSNIHLISDYTDLDGYDRYAKKRKHQLKEALSFLNEKTKKETVLFGGDFNFKPDSKLWETLSQNPSNWVFPSQFLDCPSPRLNCGVEHVFSNNGLKILNSNYDLTEPIHKESEEFLLSDHPALNVEIAL